MLRTHFAAICFLDLFFRGFVGTRESWMASLPLETFFKDRSNVSIPRPRDSQCRNGHTIRCCDQMKTYNHAMWPTTEVSEVRGSDWATQAGMLRCNARLLGQRRAEKWTYLSSVVVRSKLPSTAFPLSVVSEGKEYEPISWMPSYRLLRGEKPKESPPRTIACLPAEASKPKWERTAGPNLFCPCRW